MKINIQAVVKGDLNSVWRAWNDPDDIKQWCAPSNDWHTTRSAVDLREGGKFLSRMEAKDGSAGFDLEGTYTRVVPKKLLEFKLDDGRDVKVEFTPIADGILVKEAFEPESENPPEVQRQGWQAILDNFAKHVEAKASIQ